MVSVRPELQTTSVTADGDASSAGQKFAAEYHLLASLPSTIGSGIVNSAKDAYEHKTRTVLEAASALVLGAGFSLLSKNPNPIVAATTTWLGRAFVGVAAADLGYRFGQPMTDVWQHTSHLQADQLKLGNNIGDAVFNYGIAIGEGGIGAKLGERYLAQTRFGSFLQGFTETTVDGKLLNDPIVSQPVENKPVESQPTKPSPLIDAIRQARGGDETLIARPAATAATTPIEQGFTGSVRLRTFSDGSQVAFDNNHVLVSTKDGAHMWFKNKQSFLGLRDQLDLKRVVQPSAEGGTGQTSADVFLKKGRLGSDLGSGTTNFFSPEGQTYVFSDGLKLSTDLTQRVTEVETPFAKIFSPQRGSWRYNLSADMPSPVVPTAGTIGAVSAPKPIEVNLTNFTSSGRPYKKGLEGALGQMMLERAGDIGTSVFEHYVLIRGDDK